MLRYRLWRFLMVLGVFLGLGYVVLMALNVVGEGQYSWKQEAIEILTIVLLTAPAIWWAILRVGDGGLFGDLTRARALVEAMSDGIISVNEEGRVVSFNPAAERLSGWSAEAIVGRPFWMLIAEAEREAHIEDFRRMLNDPGDGLPRAIGQVRSIRQDGTEFIADLNVSVVRGRKGRMTLVAVLRDVTKASATHEALRRQERHFRSLIENSTDITTVLGADGKVLYESPAFERTFGHRAAEWQGRSVFEMIWPDDADLARSLFMQAVRAPGSPVAVKLRLTDVHGNPRWIEGTGINFLDDPAVGGIVINSRDVTARHNTEQRLIQLSRAVEQSRASIVITDPDGAIQYVNPAFCTTTGYSREEVIGKNPRILNAGTLRKDVYRDLWTTILSGRDWRGDLHNRTRSGELYWETATISPIVDETGAITHFVAVKDDITERKWAEERLRASERRFHQAFTHAAVGMALVGIDGRFLRVNSVLCEITGYSAEELRERTFQDITHGDDLPSDLEFVRRLLNNEISTYQMEKRYLRKDGNEVWTQLNVSLVRSDDDQPLYFVSQIQDISVRRRAQLEIERSARVLESANRRLQQERLEREKVETELRLAQKLEAVGQLAAGIAHEINTPMQYIGDSVHFLQQGCDDLIALMDRFVRSAVDGGVPAVRLDEDTTSDLEYLRERMPHAFTRTLEGIERVTAIVRAMKEFAHPDAREKQPVDINKALANALIVARNEYKYVADVETEYGDMPPVPCHAGEINQVFLNLIVNAAHAIADVVGESAARGTIRIVTRAEEHGIVVSIQDTGTGIPDEIQTRVFDPFFTTKAVGRGTGQGLAIAHSIVDKHGGSLAFTTEIGRGTTFTIRLPAGADPGRAEGVAA